MKRTSIALLFAATLPLAAQAGPRSDLSAELAQARAELRVELAMERAKLDNEPLSLGDGVHFGSRDRTASAKRLPPAEITAAGDFRVDGRTVAVDATQRRQLLAYRANVIDVAKAGIEAGEKAALLAMDAVDGSMFHLIVGGLTGSLERRVTAVVQRELKPTVLRICHQLPQLKASQQSLAAGLPAFRPYATLQDEDVARCEADVGRDLAVR